MVTYNYEQLTVTIDTREWDTDENNRKQKDRMGIVRRTFEKLGAIVQRKKIDYCDYSILGNLLVDGEEFPVNIGFQYKQLGGDLSPSLPSLPETLFNAHKVFKDVCLIVEENGSYDLVLNVDESDGMFQIPVMQAVTGKTGSISYQAYTNFMQSVNMCGVQARAIRSNEHLPMTMIAMMKYAVKPIHAGLFLIGKDYNSYFKNVMAKFPGTGILTVEKLFKCVYNLEHLCSLQEDEIALILKDGGKNENVRAKTIYRFLHNQDRKEEVKINSQKLMAGELQKIAQPAIKEIIEKPKQDPQIATILDFIRIKKDGVTLADVKRQFGYSDEKCFHDLMKLAEEGKIWKNKKSKLWLFGKDQNPPAVLADKEMDIGV